MSSPFSVSSPLAFSIRTVAQINEMTNIFRVLFITLLFYPNLEARGNDESFKETIVENNKYLSKQFDSLAQEIDTLLSNRRGKVPSNSRLRLLGYFESREGGIQNQSFFISADLRLPKLEKKWKVRFSSYDREDEFEGLQRNRNGVAPREQKSGASVGLIRKVSGVNFLLRPRIELKDPLVSSMLLKLNGDLQITSWALQWQLKFFAHSVDGVGQSAAFDFEKDLTNRLVLRLFNEQQYLDRDNVFRVAQGPSFLYKLNDLMGLSTTLAFNSANRNISTRFTEEAYGAENYHLTSYRWDITFSHKLLRNVFHYQLTPLLEFPKQRGFKGWAGIILRTEIIF